MTSFMDLDVKKFIRAVTMHENQENIDNLFFILDRLKIKNVQNFRYDGGRLKEVPEMAKTKVKEIYDYVIQEIDKIITIIDENKSLENYPEFETVNALLSDAQRGGDGGKRRKKSKSKNRKKKSKSKRKRSKIRRKRR